MLRLEFGLEVAMAPYLGLDEVRANAGDIRAAFESLLGNPRVAARPSSKQWAFLQSCFARLMDPFAEEVHVEQRKAAQYRFEIEKRLRKHYQRAGTALAFAFLLTDRGHALRQELVDDEYPSNAGYVLLVARGQPEAASASERASQEYFARLVEDAARAEFAAYEALPEVRLEPLERLFVKDGPAYRRIRDLVERHARRKDTIRQPEYNPSTMRVLDVRVGEVSDEEATVLTEEHWYLRWWSLTESRYVYVYNETNRQRYLLTRVDGRWLIDANLYPPPRATSSARQLGSQDFRR